MPTPKPSSRRGGANRRNKQSGKINRTPAITNKRVGYRVSNKVIVDVPQTSGTNGSFSFQYKISPLVIPWVKQLCPLFLRWKLHNLVVRWKPNLSPMCGGNIAMAINYDFAVNTDPSSLENVSLYEGSVTLKYGSEGVISYRAKDKAREWYIFDNDTSAVNGISNFSCPGVVVLDGFATDYTGKPIADKVQPGYLIIEYDLELLDASPINKLTLAAIRDGKKNDEELVCDDITC